MCTLAWYAVVEKTKHMTMLGSCTSGGPHIRRTWTPDWTEPQVFNLLSTESVLGNLSTNTISFHASNLMDCKVVFSNNSVMVDGISWDVIDLKTTTVWEDKSRLLKKAPSF